MRTITHSEFQAASGEPVYVSTVHYASRAEREAGDAAAQRVVTAAAFVPGDGLAGIVGKGKPFDPDESWPSDKTAREYPPNCDGFGQEPTQVGQLIAQAGYTAAEGDGECSTVGCVIPQAKDNGSN